METWGHFLLYSSNTLNRFAGYSGKGKDPGNEDGMMNARTGSNCPRPGNEVTVPRWRRRNELSLQRWNFAMGQEQSVGRIEPDAVPKNVPYTSYSVDKPGARPKGKAKVEDIMVVSDGSGNRTLLSRNEDEDLRKLNSLPQSLPLLRGQGNSSTPIVLENFDVRPLLEMCLRFESHQRQCSEAVTFDQDMLATRIKETDTYCSVVLRKYMERYKRLSHTAFQVKKVEEMKTTLKRIDASFKLLVPMMERLNNVLPEDERLEVFTIEPSHSIQNG